jgi:hypothetical protein
MAIGQRERRTLQEALVSSIGAESTDTLMDYLPPVGWADVATKHDLDVLAGKLDALAANVDACATKEALDALAGKVDACATKEALDALAGKVDACATKDALDALAGKVDALGIKVDALANRVNELALKVEGCATKQDLQTQFYRTITLMVLLLTAFTAVIKLT